MTTTAVVTSPRTGVKLAAVPTNRNTEWLNQKAAWAFYIILILLSWLVIASWTDPGLAWTYVHLGHGAITYFLLHWNKGSPIQDDQGIYDSMTFWEQIDDGVQGTATRKFFTVVPVVLFLLASHATDFRRQPLGLNLLVVVVLTIAKTSRMHRVRIFGINSD
ncbi:hypothetical protein ABPG77_001690 [Micractinium sp. CCAP 211/92]